MFFVVYGVGTALKQIVKYALKFWFPKTTPLEERILTSEKKIENMTSYIDEQYGEIKEAVGVIKTYVESNIQEANEKSKYEAYRRRNEASKISDLKKDVASIKFLLPTSGSVGRRNNNNNQEDTTQETKSDKSTSPDSSPDVNRNDEKSNDGTI